MPANGVDSKRCATSDMELEVTKRLKCDSVGPLRGSLMDEQSRTALKEAFQNSVPYTHVVIKDLCKKEVLVKARDELINGVEAKFKETDLFKVCYNFIPCFRDRLAFTAQ